MPIPPHFGQILLNTDIKQVDPYLLPVPQHVTVNHLYVYQEGRSKVKSDVVVLGVTQRYKSKFVTTVYYKPRS